MRDIKELIGVLMRVTNGGEVTEGEVLDLEFDADGELLTALNAAYITLLEFVHDRSARATDRALDHTQRAVLREKLSRIVALCDAVN